jgi:outer membrane receptor protein involved in Fe transport
MSLALFAKQFDHPIERILVQRSDGNEPAATFRNSQSAKNYGVELELRRNLSAVSSALLPFTLFANLTWMQSEIRPSADSLSSLTSARRPMVGQAEYVVNAGLTYTGAGRTSATLLYNVVGPRISEAAIFPLPDVYEQKRHVLDLSLQLPLAAGTTIKLDAKNLLDSPYRWTQGTVERLHYRTGRVFSAGVSWDP